MKTALFVPCCSITTTKRRRFFWAAWWSGPPAHVPFRKPDASDGGAATYEDALALATERAGVPLAVIDSLWARAWVRVLRGEDPWPSAASREPRAARAGDDPSGAPRAEGAANAASIWAVLGVAQTATDEELKAAYRKRARETHPDQGGDAEAFQRVVRAYAEAKLRRAKRGSSPRRGSVRRPRSR